MSAILVIGASGKTGRHLVPDLVARGASVRAASRSPEQLDPTGAEAVRFDWHEDETWGPAVEGAEAVFLVKPESADVADVVGRFLDVASASGVSRLVLLSECAAQTRSSDHPERRVEQLVEASDLEWTIVRPSWFMQDIVDDHFFGGLVRDHQMIVMTTGGSATAWIDARDIADVAAEILANGGAARQALNITGPSAFTLDQLAQRISAVTDEAIAGIEESLQSGEERMRAEGAPEEFIAYMTRISESIIAGDTAEVTSDVERLTGRPARSLEAFLSEHAASLTADRRMSRPASSDANADDELCLAQKNEALFRRQVSAWARNDLDALIECYADDMVYTDMPFPKDSVAGKVAFRQHMEAYNALFAGGQVALELVSLTASSTNVVGELLCRAQYVGPGTPTGGVAISWYATLVDTVVNGKIATEHAYYDPTAFERAAQQATK